MGLRYRDNFGFCGLAAPYFLRTRHNTVMPDPRQPAIKRGGAYQAKGDFDHAIADLDKALQLDPKSALALFRSRVDLSAAQIWRQAYRIE